MKEIWKDIAGYEGLYQVSNLGRIKSLDKRIPSKLRNQVYTVKKGKMLVPNCNNNSGYFKVRLTKEGKTFNCLVHRLVAEAFLQNNDNKPQVNHKDGNKLNNKVENLEWSTNKENRKHALANNLHVCGEKCTWSKLTEENVIFIRANKDASAKELAEKFNVSVSTIKDIINNRTWKQLKSYAELSQNEVIEARDKKLLR